MAKRLTYALVSIGLLLFAALVLLHGQPEFLYHTGVVAVVPDETVLLRFYFRNAMLRVSDVTVTSLVGDGCDFIEVLDSTCRTTFGSGALGAVALKVRVRGTDDKVITALHVRVSRKDMVVPVGQVKLVCVPYVDPEVHVAALTMSTMAVEKPEYGVSQTVPLTSDAEIRGLLPGLGSMARVVISNELPAPDNARGVSAWTFTLADSLWWSPSCLVYRPVLQTSLPGRSEYSLGPLIQVITRMRAK